TKVIKGGQTQGLPGNPVAGAITAIAIHPINARIVYIGTANGGVWRTDDIEATKQMALHPAVEDQLRDPAPDTKSAATSATESVAAGNLPKGKYVYVFTFYNDTMGTESNASASVSITIADQLPVKLKNIELKKIPIGPAGTTARKIYRNDPGDNTFKLVETLNDNTTKDYTDNKPRNTLTDPPMITVPYPHWEHLTDSWDCLGISALVFDPSDPTGNTLYAGTGNVSSTNTSGTAIGLLKTIDGGRTWSPKGFTDQDLRGLKITDITFSAPKLLPQSGLYGTAPGITGVTVTNASAVGGQLPAGTYQYKITFVDKETGRESLASEPITVTLAPGQNQITFNILPRDTSTGATDTNRARYIYRTTPDGSAFYLVHVVDHNKAVLDDTKVDPEDKNWVDKGPVIIPAVLVSSLPHESDPATRGGVYRSEDGGETWSRVSGTTAGAPTGLPPGYITSIEAIQAEDPTKPAIVFAAHAGDKRNASAGAGVYKSVDGGKTWKKNGTDPSNGNIPNGIGAAVNYNFAGAEPIRIMLAVQAIDLIGPNVNGTVAEKGSGGQLAAGDYIYRITFLTYNGIESAPSADITASAVAADGKVTLTNLPTGPYGTAARRIYRKDPGEATFDLVATINDNSTRSFTDTFATPVNLTGNYPEDYPKDTPAPPVLGKAAGTSAHGGNMANGNYTYRITFLFDDGVESAPSDPISVTVAVGDDKVILTNLPTGPTGTAARRIYRKGPAPADTYNLVATINDNTSGTLTDTLGNAIDPAGAQNDTSPKVEKTAGEIADNGQLMTAGNYTYRITYMTPNGFESAPSDSISVPGVIADKKVVLTNLPTGPHGTAARRIYRKIGDGGAFSLIGTVYDNVTTTFTDLRDPLNLGDGTDGLRQAKPDETKAEKSGGGRLSDGGYNYRITFLANDGVESNPLFNIEVAGVTLNGKVTLTNIPRGPASTVARRIYRRGPGAGNFSLVATLTDNTTTTYVDALGAAIDFTNLPDVPHLTRVYVALSAGKDEAPLKNSKNKMSRLWVTDNLGTEWRFVVDTPGTVDTPGGTPTFYGLHTGGGQSDLHFSIGASPTVPDILYLGGNTQAVLNQEASVNNSNYVGRLFRLDTSKGIDYTPIINAGDVKKQARGEPIISDNALLRPPLQGSTGVTTAVSATEVGANLSAGVYKYKITFVDSAGTESNPSKELIANPNLAAAGKITLNNIPRGPEGTKRINIYRTKADGIAYFFVASLQDAGGGIPQTYNDNTADIDLKVLLKGLAAPDVNSAAGDEIKTKLKDPGGSRADGGAIAPANQDYEYRFVFFKFIRGVLTYSSASEPVTVHLGAGHDTLELINIPIGPQGTQGRFIFRRELVGARQFRAVGFINDNTTTNHIDQLGFPTQLPSILQEPLIQGGGREVNPITFNPRNIANPGPGANVTVRLGAYHYKMAVVDDNGIESGATYLGKFDLTGANNAVDLENLPAVPAGTMARKFYRTEVGKDKDSDYAYIGALTDNGANKFEDIYLFVPKIDDMQNNSEAWDYGVDGKLTDGLYKYKLRFFYNHNDPDPLKRIQSPFSGEITINTAPGGTGIELKDIPKGPADTTAREIFRTAVNSATFKRYGSINNNAFTGPHDDKRADGTLGAAPKFDKLQKEKVLPTPLFGTAPHADSRVWVVDSQGRIMEADDGGIYRLDHYATGAWQALVGDLHITEVSSVAFDPGTGTILVGTQDNGTQVQVGPDSSIWRVVGVGDGGVQAVGWNDDFTEFYHYAVGNTFDATVREKYDKDGKLLETKYVGQAGSGGEPGFRFQNVLDADKEGGFLGYPFVVNAANHKWLMFGYDAIYRSDDYGDTFTKLPAAERDSNLEKVWAIAYGGMNRDGTPNPLVIYRARGSKINVSDDNGASWIGDRELGVKIEQIVLDPTNWEVAYAVGGSKVFATANHGQDWIDITGLSTGAGTLPRQELKTVAIIPVDLPDLYFTLPDADDTKITVTLRGARTVAELETWIEFQSRTDLTDDTTERLSVTIDTTASHRRLIVETTNNVAVDGTKKLKIEALNDSPAGLALGLIDKIDTPKTAPDTDKTKIEGADLGNNFAVATKLDELQTDRADLLITLRTGDVFYVSLRGAVTVGDVKNLIETQSRPLAGGDARVTVTIDEANKRFVIEQAGAVAGAGNFKIEKMNNSPAGDSLKIIKTADAGTPTIINGDALVGDFSPEKVLGDLKTAIGSGIGVRRSADNVDVLLVGGSDGVFRTINPLGDPSSLGRFPQNVFSQATVIVPGENNDLLFISKNKDLDLSAIKVTFEDRGAAVLFNSAEWNPVDSTLKIKIQPNITKANEILDLVNGTDPLPGGDATTAAVREAFTVRFTGDDNDKSAGDPGSGAIQAHGVSRGKYFATLSVPDSNNDLWIIRRGGVNIPRNLRVQFVDQVREGIGHDSAEWNVGDSILLLKITPGTTSASDIVTLLNTAGVDANTDNARVAFYAALQNGDNDAGTGVPGSGTIPILPGTIRGITSAARQATISIEIPGNNNDLRFTTVRSGDSLNDATVHFVNQSGTGPATVTWNPFTEQLVFDVRDNTTANDVLAILNGPDISNIGKADDAGGKLAKGAYVYKISFLDNTGAEGNLSTPIPIEVRADNSHVTLSNIPAGPAGTVARKIYRTSKDSTAFTLVGTLNGNDVGNFTDYGPGFFDPAVQDDSRRDAPDVVITATDNVRGQLAAGTYEYKITFLTDAGSESQKSDPVSITLTTNNNQVLLTEIPRGGEEIEARRIYRKDPGGADFHLIGTLNDNWETMFIDRGLSGPVGTAPDVTKTVADPAPKNGNTSAGIYQYKISYVTNTGVESQMSAAISTGDTVSAGKMIWLDEIPRSPDTDVAARRIYRTDANGAQFHLIATLNDNEAGRFFDIVGDRTTAPDVSVAKPNVAGTSANLWGNGGQLGAGTYGYRITFLDNKGVESNASETLSINVKENNSQVCLTQIPTGFSDVVARRIYRTALNGTTFGL
ncbi:hypothetical protein ACFL9U_10530, partial [Thermodesulfobacteriota bacterium]